MPIQYFLLDSNATGYAAAIAALVILDANKFSFTPIQTIRSADHDSTLKVVKANVTEAELNGDGDLVNLRTANFPTELCRDRYTSLADFRVRGFHVLNEAVRSTEGIAERSAIYVRRITSGRTQWGEDTGYTPYDAKQIHEFNWPSGGATVYFCDAFIRERIHTPTSPHAAENMNDFPEGDFSADPLIIRMDHPLMPGQFVGGLMSQSQSIQDWTQDGSDPDVWFKEGGAYADYTWGFVSDPTKSTSDLLSENLLTHVTSEAAVRATPWSWWKDEVSSPAVTWVNLPGGEDPRHRVGWTGFGTNPGWNYNDALLGNATQRSKGIHHINCQFINIGSLGLGTTYFPESRWEGGRYLLGSSFKPQTCKNTYWGWSTDGEIPFDTSDRPNADTDPDLLTVVAEHGSDYATWKNRMPNFLQIAVAPEGVYEYGGGFTDKAGFTMQGVLGESIGAHSIIGKQIGSFSHFDGHFVGQQGVSNMHISFVIITREDNSQVGNPMEFYVVNDILNAQNIQNCIVEDFVVKGGAIGFSGPGTFERQTGNGYFAGNIVRRGVCRDNPLTGNEASYGNPALPAGAYGVFSSLNDSPVTVDNVTFDTVANPIGGEYNTDYCRDASEGQNPVRGWKPGVGWIITNCRFKDWETRIIMQRQTQTHWNLQTIVSITKANPCVVEVTGHGFPDFTTPEAGTYAHPEVYFDNMVGMVELDGNVCRARWIDANHFSLETIAGSSVDSSAFGDFISGGCERANGCSFVANNNTLIKLGVDADTKIFKYANGNQSLNEMQGNSYQRHLPGAAANDYWTSTTIVSV